MARNRFRFVQLMSVFAGKADIINSSARQLLTHNGPADLAPYDDVAAKGTREQLT